MRVHHRGSSPRVRGKPPSSYAHSDREGLIPACAGKTPGRSRPWRPRSAHPRVCGENRNAVTQSTSFAGSSPRVRGKRWSRSLRWVMCWLIPACAGKTENSQSAYPGSEAHPRVCGENRDLPWRIVTPGGSSPRVRGKLDPYVRPAARGGLIPACAGKTTGRRVHERRRWAHPRVCGENSKSRRGSLAVGGSSPRVRGKPRWLESVGIPEGLIPACAGKTR